MNPYIESEVILGGWSRRVETSSGVTDGYIKLYLPDDSCLDILARLPDTDLRGTKKSGGKLFKLILVEYDGTEAETMPEIEFEAPPEPIRLSAIAAIMCRENTFEIYCRNFLKEYILLMQKEGHWDFAWSREDKLSAIIRYACSIKSRAELDSDKAASDIFNQLFYKPYYQWRRGE